MSFARKKVAMRSDYMLLTTYKGRANKWKQILCLWTKKQIISEA